MKRQVVTSTEPAGPARRRVISWGEGLQAAQGTRYFVCAAASSPAFSTAGNGNAQPAAPAPAKHEVFAILSVGDTPPCFVLVLGVLRAEDAVFPISPRLPPPAAVALLARAHAIRSLLSADEGMQEFKSRLLRRSRMSYRCWRRLRSRCSSPPTTRWPTQNSSSSIQASTPALPLSDVQYGLLIESALVWHEITSMPELQERSPGKIDCFAYQCQQGRPSARHHWPLLKGRELFPMSNCLTKEKNCYLRKPLPLIPIPSICRSVVRLHLPYIVSPYLYPFSISVGGSTQETWSCHPCYELRHHLRFWTPQKARLRHRVPQIRL